MEPSISLTSYGFISFAELDLDGVEYEPKGLESNPQVGLTSSSVLARSRNLDLLALASLPIENEHSKHTRCTIHNVTNTRLRIKSRQEFLSLFIVPDLGELERSSPTTILGHTSQPVGRVADGVRQGTWIFTSWLTIGNGDDQHGFLKGLILYLVEDQRFNNLTSQFRADWSEALEWHLGDECFHLLF